MSWAAFLSGAASGARDVFDQQWRQQLMLAMEERRNKYLADREDRRMKMQQDYAIAAEKRQRAYREEDYASGALMRDSEKMERQQDFQREMSESSFENQMKLAEYNQGQANWRAKLRIKNEKEMKAAWDKDPKFMQQLFRDVGSETSKALNKFYSGVQGSLRTEADEEGAKAFQAMWARRMWGKDTIQAKMFTMQTKIDAWSKEVVDSNKKYKEENPEWGEYVDRFLDAVLEPVENPTPAAAPRREMTQPMTGERPIMTSRNGELTPVETGSADLNDKLQRILSGKKDVRLTVEEAMRLKSMLPPGTPFLSPEGEPMRMP